MGLGDGMVWFGRIWLQHNKPHEAGRFSNVPLQMCIAFLLGPMGVHADIF